MKEDDFLFTVPDGRSRHRYWLAGMDWAPQKKQSVRLPSFSRNPPPPVPGWACRWPPDGIRRG